MTGSIFLGSTSYAVNETEEFVTITIERTGDLSGAVDVQYATNPDGASQGVDFIDTDGTATIAAGESIVSVTIPIIDDALSEATENFNVSLITVSSGSLLFPRTANVLILDDENPVVDPVDPPKISDYDVVLEDVVGGLNQPLNIEWLPGSPNLAIVVEKGGILKILNTQTETVVSTLLDIRSEVNSTGDRGLMDIALHPDFENNPYLYAYVIVDPADAASQSGNAGLDGGGNRYAHVVRYTVDDSGTLPTIDPASKVILVGGAGQSLTDISGNGAQDFTNVNFENERASDVDATTGEYVQDYIKADSSSHVGGALAFGPDGMLYISTGDGVSFDYADGRAVSVQSNDALAGKILRVDPLTGDGLIDNPFVDEGDDLTTNESKVYQSGLRNPYVITFSEDGKLFISETGWFSWEEINQGEAGANFGWPYYEGGDSGILEKTPIFQNLESAPAFYAGVDDGSIVVTAAYRGFSHLESDPGYSMAAIIGSSSIYTGEQYPEIFQDDYFFFDIVGKDLFSVDTNDRTQLNFLKTLNASEPIVNFAQSPDGFLYVMLFNGTIKKLVITDPNPPQNTAPIIANPIEQQSAAIGNVFDFALPPSTFFDAEGDELSFTATLASGSALPSWLNFNPVTGAFTGTPATADAGNLAITVTAADPSGLSSADTFSLMVNEQNAVPVLTLPADNQNANSGETVLYTLPVGMFVDDGPVTLSATLSNGSALPQWLTFDPVAGTFSGTPANADAGTFVVTVTAKDSANQTAQDSFLFTVAAGNSAPVAVGMISDQVLDSGDALSAVLASGLFTDADNDPLILTATLANGDPLPSWLNFDANTATFSGTPLEADEGALSVRVISTDPSGASASIDFAIQINSVVPGVPVTDNPFADQSAAED
ncbi:PQQ-dependent sugar dehydrogenase, partial [Ahrensia sp. AH-315-G08]|nr:PQQ-dependent sugar dehydrogenase [Ahrensia sp. AH-315-G08]